MSPIRVALVCSATLFMMGASCLGPATVDAGAPADDRPVIGDDCGDPGSDGNDLGIGRHCQATSDCPVLDTGTTIQCSTVLTDDALPLLCSRLCGDTDGGSIDCGAGATCMNIEQLGYDLDVCVPFTCDPLFDGGVPRP